MSILGLKDAFRGLYFITWWVLIYDRVTHSNKLTELSPSLQFCGDFQPLSAPSFTKAWQHHISNMTESHKLHINWQMLHAWEAAVICLAFSCEICHYFQILKFLWSSADIFQPLLAPKFCFAAYFLSGSVSAMFCNTIARIKVRIGCFIETLCSTTLCITWWDLGTKTTCCHGKCQHRLPVLVALSQLNKQRCLGRKKNSVIKSVTSSRSWNYPIHLRSLCSFADSFWSLLAPSFGFVAHFLSVAVSAVFCNTITLKLYFQQSSG